MRALAAALSLAFLVAAPAAAQSPIAPPGLGEGHLDKRPHGASPIERPQLFREPYEHKQPLWIVPTPLEAQPSPALDELVRRLSEEGLRQSQALREQRGLLQKIEPPAGENAP